MARREDGRVEPGQSLKSAFSARAWNRSQDAADIVLGDRGALTVPPSSGGRTGQLILPCRVTTAHGGVTVGHAVEIQNASIIPPILNEELEDPPQKFTVPQKFALTGRVLTARSLAVGFNFVAFNSFREAVSVAIGVIVGGPVMPSPNNPQVVEICVRGPCAVRVRNRAAFPRSRFLRPAFIQRPTDTEQNLHGCLEQADEGQAIGIAMLPNAYRDSKPGIAQHGTGDNIDDRSDIIWFLAML